MPCPPMAALTKSWRVKGEDLGVVIGFRARYMVWGYRVQGLRENIIRFFVVPAEGDVPPTRPARIVLPAGSNRNHRAVEFR